MPDGVRKTYPFVELDATPRPLVDRVGVRTVRVEFDAPNRTGRILDETGHGIRTVIAFWFARFAFHPRTEVHRAEAASTCKECAPAAVPSMTAVPR